jgi:hypothetical protein
VSPQEIDGDKSRYRKLSQVETPCVNVCYQQLSFECFSVTAGA